ncbi:MAG: sialidase family protein [Planctomycetota bacterium]
MATRPKDFIIFTDRAVTPASASRSNVGEPSHAAAGKYIFYTGNWYAARSTDGGTTWSYINPYADMADFCCDQEVIYDASRDLFLWYRQGVPDGNGRNRFRLGASSDGAATWCFYDIYTEQVNAGWINTWFDYPHIALGTNFLYIATNRFNSAGFWVETDVLAWPLDAIRFCQGFGYNYFGRTDSFTLTPVQGATVIMYLGSHVDTDTLRIYSWTQGSGSYSWNDINIAAWSGTSRGSAHCPSPDGTDACQRLDDRINGGWVAQGLIGFFWTVREGGGFSYPYVESATFSQQTKAYMGRPYIWNSAFAWIYGYACPDTRGYLGIAAWLSGGGNYPAYYVGIDDDFNGSPPGWEVALVEAGNDGPNDNKWGDYNRIRQFGGCQRVWTASGHVLQNGGNGANTSPRFAVFGRERERFCYNRFATK